MVTETNLYGLMAEFDEPEPLLEAARRAHAAGYRHMDAYSPMPVEGLAEAIGFRTQHGAAISVCALASGGDRRIYACAGG